MAETVTVDHQTTLLQSEKTLNAALEEMLATVAQHSHIVDRVTQLEER